MITYFFLQILSQNKVKINSLSEGNTVLQKYFTGKI